MKDCLCRLAYGDIWRTVFIESIKNARLSLVREEPFPPQQGLNCTSGETELSTSNTCMNASLLSALDCGCAAASDLKLCLGLKPGIQR